MHDTVALSRMHDTNLSLSCFDRLSAYRFWIHSKAARQTLAVVHHQRFVVHSVWRRWNSRVQIALKRAFKSTALFECDAVQVLYWQDSLSKHTIFTP